MSTESTAPLSVAEQLEKAPLESGGDIHGRVNAHHRDWVRNMKDALSGESYAMDSKRNVGWTQILHFGIIINGSGSGHPLCANLSVNERQVLDQARAILNEKFKTLTSNDTIYAKLYTRLGSSM